MYRSRRTPDRQARDIVGRLVNHPTALRRNPERKRPPSVGTVRNYRECLTQTAALISPLQLRDLTPEDAVDYLDRRAAGSDRKSPLGQKALDMHRQALEAMLVHVTHKLPSDGHLKIVRASQKQRLTGRAYTPEQVRRVAAAQSPRNALATELAYAAGLRAHELLTLARPGEQRPDRRPAMESKFLGRPGRDYTVVGKGGLVRTVRIPDDLADRLEARRRSGPLRVTDRGVHYRSRYDVGGGHAWSESFSSASKRVLDWSTGAHGLRHSYAQERMRELRRHMPYDDARETVSQELGHFRPRITNTYLR